MKRLVMFLFCSAWRLGFLANNFFGLLKVLAKFQAIILVKVRKILQKFFNIVGLQEEIQEMQDIVNKFKAIQDCPKFWQEKQDAKDWEHSFELMEKKQKSCIQKQFDRLSTVQL